MSLNRFLFHTNNQDSEFSLNPPTTSSSSRCGPGISNSFLTSRNPSLSSHTYNWYDAISGGTLLQQGGDLGGVFYLGIWSGNTLYASEVYESYESVRVPVTTTLLPSLGITANSNTAIGCSNQSMNLSIIQDIGGYNYTRTTWTANPWSGSGLPNTGITVDNTTINVTPLSSGSYTYRVYAYSDVSSCGALSEININVADLPDLSVSPVFDVCEGSEITLSASSSNGVEFIWTSSNYPALTGAVQTINLTVADEFTVTVYNSNGCFNSSSFVVGVISVPPTPSKNDGTDICGYGVSDASVSSNYNVGTPIFKWFDSPSGGVLLQEGEVSTFMIPLTATTTFYVSEINSNGCESSRVDVTTIVNPADAIDITGPSSLIVNNPIDLTVVNTELLSNTYTKFIWSATPELGSGVINDESFNTETINITPTIVGTYIYTVIVRDDDKNCLNITNHQVVVS